MNDSRKTKAQLIQELESLRAELAESRRRGNAAGTDTRRGMASADLIESLSASVIVHRGRTICFASAAAESLTGYTPKELRGLDLVDLACREFKPYVRERDAARQRGEDLSDQFEIRIARKDGGTCWIDCRVSPIKFEGEPASLTIAYDITERKQIEHALRARMEFEYVVSGISTKFINLPSNEIHAGVNDALKALGQSARVDRSYVFLFSDDGNRMSNTHEWCAKNIPPAMPRLQDLPTASLPWFSERIKRRETIHVPRVSDLPQEASAERKEWETEEIESLVCVPMVCSGVLIGFVGFDSVRKAKSWSEEIIALLRIVGEIIANALQRRRTEEKLRLLSTAVEQSSECIAVADLNGNLLFANNAFAKLHGLALAEIQYKHLSIFHTPEQLPSVEDANRCIRETGEFSGEIWHVRSDGTVFPTHTRNTLVRNEFGEPIAVLGTARDITEHKRAQESAQSAQEELEQRVRERTADLTSANERLQSEAAERERAEEKLREQEELLRNVISNVPHYVFWKDRNSVFLGCNQNLARVAGLRSPEDIIGKTDYDLAWQREEAEFFRHCDREVMDRGEPMLNIEEPQHQADGKDATLLTSKVPLRDRDGQVVGILGIYADITSRKQAEQALRESEARFRLLCFSAPIGILLTDADGQWVYVNERMQEITGASPDNMLGWAWHECIHAEDRETVIEDTFRSSREGGVYSGEFRVQTPGGAVRWVDMKMALMVSETGKLTGKVGTVQDITERQRAAEEIRNAKEAAEAANLAKSKFLANMSHEIRTPITAMLGAAELFQRTDTDHATQQDLSERILRNGQHLLCLIDDLLDLSRVEAGKLDVKPIRCSLPGILVDVHNLTAHLHHGSAVDFRIFNDTDIPAHIHTDPTRLKQAITNLISNALKFTRAGHVWARVSVDREAPEPALTVGVEDTGVGIPPTGVEHIFETFAQIDQDPSDSVVARGVGLGLPLTKWITERLSGSLRVESVENKGSTFTLTVPTGPLDDVDWLPPGEAFDSLPGSAPDSPPQFEHKLAGRVLLADDFRDARELVLFALAEAGADVVAVEDGEEAVQAAARQAFDLIVLDIRMPRMNGLAAADAIRRSGFDGPIIALTASTSENDKGRILRAGFDDCWRKPISLVKLVEAASEYLNRPTDDYGNSAVSEPATPSRRDLDLAAAIAQFERGLGDRIQKLRNAVRESDETSVREILHQLIGTGGICGHMELSREAGRLRELVSQGLLLGRTEHLETIDRLARDIRPTDDTEGGA